MVPSRNLDHEAEVILTEKAINKKIITNYASLKPSKNNRIKIGSSQGTDSSKTKGSSLYNLSQKENYINEVVYRKEKSQTRKRRKTKSKTRI